MALDIVFNPFTQKFDFVQDITETISLDDLSDVTITSASEGQVLYYDANTSLWKNTSIILIDDVNNRVGINRTPGATLEVETGGGNYFQLSAGALAYVNGDFRIWGNGGNQLVVDNQYWATDLEVGTAGQVTLTGNADWDCVLFKKDYDGDSSSYSEAGSVLRLERDLTNVSAENGYFMEWGNTGGTDGFIGTDGSIHLIDDVKLTLGTGNDASIYVSSDDLYIENDTQDKDIFVKVNDGGSDKVLMTFDSSNMYVGVGEAAPATDLYVSKNTAGQQVQFKLQNLETTHQQSEAVMDMTTTSLSGADPYMRWSVTPDQSWTLGIDNGSADELKIAQANLNTNVTIVCETDKTVSFPNDSQNVKFGTGKDSTIYYDGTDMVIDTSLVGSGLLKIGASNMWTANGAGNVTISNVAPAGVGTATISKWLTVKDDAGTTYYIPAWT